MSWYSKVAWSEGLFLRQHHLQQSDRYVEQFVENRTRNISPYPWGFAAIEIDRDLAQQNKFALRRASGIFQDGTPFDMPGFSPLALAIDLPEGTEKQLIWMTMPAASVNSREVDMAEATSGSRYVRDIEPVIDSASGLHVEEEIEVAHPRISFEIRKTPKAGFHCLKVARVSRGSRQVDHLRRNFRAARAGVARASGRCRLAGPRHRLDRDETRNACALCR